MKRVLPAVVVAMAFVTAAAQATESLLLINRLRAQVGLGALSVDRDLSDAARDHAAYLDRHREPGQAAAGVSAHQQQRGHSGFTGSSPGERALAAGYPHREVLENVSMGYADDSAAIDGLMRAIYHRLTFLDLRADQLGAAVGERSRVFLLGRSDIAALCRQPPAEALLQTPLDCLGTPMQRDFYTRLCADLPGHARFRAPHPVACPDGRRLDGEYMQSVCTAPPPAARAEASGRYFLPCGDRVRIDADWFLALCAGQTPEALYSGDGSYFEICEPTRRVAAEWFEALCADLPETARFTDSLRYRRPCRHAADVRVGYLDDLERARLTALPELVLWPPDGADDVPPAFFIEEPDPLPDRDVAGFPLSIQVNPGRVDDVVLQALTLQRLGEAGSQPVAATRLLDRETDPNGLLSAFEFALFPLERLAWNARYRAVAELSLDGRPRRVEWTFATRRSRAPVVTVTGPSQRIVVDNGADYWLYLPPDETHALTVRSVRSQFRHGSRVDMQVVDSNTLQVRLQAHRCDRVRLQFDSGREVVLIPRACAG